MSGDEQWKGIGALGHKSCLTVELELRERIAELVAELSRHHLTNSCGNTYHNEGCADSHRTVCEYR